MCFPIVAGVKGKIVPRCDSLDGFEWRQYGGACDFCWTSKAVKLQSIPDIKEAEGRRLRAVGLSAFLLFFFSFLRVMQSGPSRCRQTYRLSGGLAGPAKPRCSFGDAASCRSAPLGVPSRAATSSGVKAGAVLLPPLPPSRATFGLVELGSSTSGGRTTWELRMEVLWDFYRDEADFKKKKMT